MYAHVYYGYKYREKLYRNKSIRILLIKHQSILHFMVYWTIKTTENVERNLKHLHAYTA